MSGRLEGKVAIVTGGSRGIGRGIARALAAQGARVMITARDAGRCEQTAKEIEGHVDFEPGHVARADDMERVIDATLTRLGGLDVLVNNAATNPYAGLTIDVDRPRWEKTIEINLTAPLLWIQAAWRARMRESGGSIINISSVAGIRTNLILGTYGVTKAALVQLTRQLAAELAPGVRVNAVASGLVRTDFARALWEGGRGEQVARAYPLQRLGEPEDIAGAALYLADDAASGWLTGQVLVLDGGSTIAFEGRE